MSQETRLIRAGSTSGDLVKTVGPPIQRGSTVLLPCAEALYDDDAYLTYGRAGLAAVAAALGSWAWLRRAVIDHAVLPTTWPPALDRTVTALALGAAAATVVLLVWRPPGTVRASRPDGTVGTAPPPPGP